MTVIQTHWEQSLFHVWDHALLEYAVPVWDPYLGKDIHALESLQQYNLLLQKPEGILTTMNISVCLTFQLFRRNACFETLENSSWQCIQTNCPVKWDITYSIRPSSYSLQIPFARATRFYNSFACNAYRIWNTLPVEVVSSSSFYLLRRLCHFLFTAWTVLVFHLFLATLFFPLWTRLRSRD